MEKCSFGKGDVPCDSGLYARTECSRSSEDAAMHSDLFGFTNRVVGLGKASQRSVIRRPVLISKGVESKWGDGLKQWSPDINTDH